MTAAALQHRRVGGKPEREAIAYPATFATIGRLSEDLSASLQNNIRGVGQSLRDDNEE